MIKSSYQSDSEDSSSEEDGQYVFKFVFKSVYVLKHLAGFLTSCGINVCLLISSAGLKIETDNYVSDSERETLGFFCNLDIANFETSSYLPSDLKDNPEAVLAFSIETKDFVELTKKINKNDVGILYILSSNISTLQLRHFDQKKGRDLSAAIITNNVNPDTIRKPLDRIPYDPQQPQASGSGQSLISACQAAKTKQKETSTVLVRGQETAMEIEVIKNGVSRSFRFGKIRKRKPFIFKAKLPSGTSQFSAVGNLARASESIRFYYRDGRLLLIYGKLASIGSFELFIVPEESIKV